MIPRCKAPGCPFSATHAPTVVVRLGPEQQYRMFEIVLDILLCHEHGRTAAGEAVLTPRSLADIQHVLAVQVGEPFEVESLFVRMDRRPETTNDLVVRRQFLAPCSPIGGSA